MSLHRPTIALALTAMLCSALATAMPRQLAELPGSTVLSGPATQTRQIDAGDDLQQALDQARPGDTLELQAGATFDGPFVLRNHGGADWITVISSGVRQGRLPASGTRVTPMHASAMAALTASRDAVISTDPGAGYYRFVGIEIKPDNLQTLNTLVELGSGDNSVAAMPHHIVFERSYLHGDPVLATRRGIVMNGAHIAVIDSHLSGFKSVEDAQALVSWEGTGPFLIRNNYLEATGENVMFGGADPQHEQRVPSDIAIEGNHFYKPLSWQHTHASHDGSAWSIKNLLELKNARHVRIDGNLFEHNWPQAQNGFAILFTVRNQSGNSPWSQVQHVTFSNNIVRHVAAAISVLGRDDNYPSERTQDLLISNNLFYDVGFEWGSGHLFQLLNSPARISITNNTARQSGAIMFAEGDPIPGATIVDNNFTHNTAGFSGTNTAPGQNTLDTYLAAPVTIDGNILAGCGQTRYPDGIDCVPNADNFLQDARSRDIPGVDLDLLCAALSVTERPVFCTQ